MNTRFLRHCLYSALADRLMPNSLVCEPARARLVRWLLRVTVLGGAEIGAGSVVAAGALVNKSVPPNELWGGVPARLIRRLDT